LTQDLRVGDIVVAKAGSKVLGQVTTKHARWVMGQQIGPVTSLRIRLGLLSIGSFSVQLLDKEKKEGTWEGPVVPGAVVLGPVIPVKSPNYSRLVKNPYYVLINKGTALKAFTSEDANLPPL
jgi:hypothetical protein